MGQRCALDTRMAHQPARYSNCNQMRIASLHDKSDEEDLEG